MQDICKMGPRNSRVSAVPLPLIERKKLELGGSQVQVLASCISDYSRVFYFLQQKYTNGAHDGDLNLSVIAVSRLECLFHNIFQRMIEALMDNIKSILSGVSNAHKKYFKTIY